MKVTLKAGRLVLDALQPSDRDTLREFIIPASGVPGPWWPSLRVCHVTWHDYYTPDLTPAGLALEFLHQVPAPDLQNHDHDAPGAESVGAIVSRTLGLRSRMVRALEEEHREMLLLDLCKAVRAGDWSRVDNVYCSLRELTPPKMSSASG